MTKTIFIFEEFVMLYIAIGIVIHGLINNVLGWYRTWEYDRRSSVVKRGYLEYNGIRYKIIG